MLHVRHAWSELHALYSIRLGFRKLYCIEQTKNNHVRPISDYSHSHQQCERTQETSEVVICPWLSLRILAGPAAPFVLLEIQA